MKRYVIDINNEGLRLDVFLSETTSLSRSLIQRQIKDKLIKVNNIIPKSSYQLKLDDEIEVAQIKEQEVLKPTKMELNIIYEDEDIIIINKDKGVIVHPGAGNLQNTLVHGLLYHTTELSTVDENRPGIVHRLDADTSGIMIVPKNNVAHEHIATQFFKRTVIRKYYALVWGVIHNDTGTIDAPIGRDVRNRQKYTVTSLNSKNAKSHFKVIKRFDDASLLEVELETGRTHQIRVHMEYIGHPIVNDGVYSNKSPIDNTGQCLHAKTISFIHPRTKQIKTFESELPNSFKKILNQFE